MRLHQLAKLATTKIFLRNPGGARQIKIRTNFIPKVKGGALRRVNRPRYVVLGKGVAASRRITLLLAVTGAFLMLALCITPPLVFWLRRNTNTSHSFFMIQLADPQLGLFDYGGTDWSQEQSMLDLAIREVNRLSPRFIVLVGDMQNWYQTNENDENGNLATGYAPNVGELQVLSVKKSLSLLDPSIPLRATMPGNHDVGDAPTLSSLRHYKDKWGEPRGSFTEDGIRFVYMDTQIYKNSSKAGISKVAADQTAWLKRELVTTATDVGVVLLGHIAPFISDALEPEGFANWPLSVRKNVLSMTQHSRIPVPPRLFICGHFHGNVERVESKAFGAPLEIVTTSSVGCPMMWNGSTTGSYTPSQASIIASGASGKAAYDDYIIRNGDMQTPPNYMLGKLRITAVPERSGVRIFEFNPAKGYRHNWFTLEMVGNLQSPLSTKSLEGIAWTAFKPST